MATPTMLRGTVDRAGRSISPVRHNWIRRMNLALALAWAAMIPISILTGWIYSIAFIAAASIYANFISHVAAWRADVPNPSADAQPEALDALPANDSPYPASSPAR